MFEGIGLCLNRCPFTCGGYDWNKRHTLSDGRANNKIHNISVRGGGVLAEKKNGVRDFMLQAKREGGGGQHVIDICWLLTTSCLLVSGVKQA